MIFVDTGAWFASMVASDANHAVASRWLAQNNEPLITTDYVFSETITLLVMRHQRPQAEAFGASMLAGKLAQLHLISIDEIQGAWQTFLRFHDKQWSFTDCTSKVVMEKLELTTAFSFDHDFRQFGTVTVVP